MNSAEKQTANSAVETTQKQTAAQAENGSVLPSAGEIKTPAPNVSEKHSANIIAIIGGGIAGMTAALALAKQNIPSVLYEKSAVLQEVGAGIQLAPNATRLLRNLGLENALEAQAAEPDFINLSNADNGKILLHLPIKTLAEQHWRAPYLTIHRADIQKILKQAADAEPLINFVSGAAIEKISGNAQTGFALHLASADGQNAAQADYIFCCDGVWSRSRAALCGEEAVFSSYTAWRATLAREDMPAEFFQNGGGNCVSAYMSKNSHFIIYPLRKGALYNLVIVTKGENIGKTWARAGDKTQLLRLFSGQSALLRRLIEATPEWTFWPLFQMPSCRFLSKDGAIFLGDAAHAVTPFAAQGAAMAIEDACAAAVILAAGFAGKDQAKLAVNLQIFDAIRQKRLKAVAARGDFNRFIYHLSGPAALARNIAMRLRPQKRFLDDLDWLYAYDAVAPALLPA